MCLTLLLSPPKLCQLMVPWRRRLTYSPMPRSLKAHCGQLGGALQFSDEINWEIDGDWFPMVSKHGMSLPGSELMTCWRCGNTLRKWPCAPSPSRCLKLHELTKKQGSHSVGTAKYSEVSDGKVLLVLLPFASFSRLSRLSLSPMELICRCCCCLRA